jgi:phosphoenolpyruvate carboxylase
MTHSNETHLTAELRTMVKKTVALLGDVICREMGSQAFEKIEAVRKEMAELRGASDTQKQTVLNKTLEQFRDLNTSERHDWARAYTLMLELMNACENAFRTVKIRQRTALQRLETSSKLDIQAIIYVLTAHPTEARSPQNISVFQEIQGILIQAYLDGFDKIKGRLFHALELAWHTSVVRLRKPKVQDEAEHIYGTVLRDEILDTLLAAKQEFAPVYLRSWVGGDKDGHPGVDEKTLVASLELSRRYLYHSAVEHLDRVKKSLSCLESSSAVFSLRTDLQRLIQAIQKLRKMEKGDGSRVRKIHQTTRALTIKYSKVFGENHPSLDWLQNCLEVFPALVVPLEIRESSDLVLAAQKDPKQAIARMLKTLGGISGKGNPRWYVRGFIVSMTQSSEHLVAAGRLVARVFGEWKLPIVPLFEDMESLLRSDEVISEFLRQLTVKEAIRKYWNCSLEMMVGYSDSAKEGGVLPSRVGIAQAMRRLDRLVRNASIRPIFFHGSGGSVDRGGGSLSDQVSWWPLGALEIYKVTLQGEMVERSFASPEMVIGQLQHLFRSAREFPPAQTTSRSSSAVIDFAKKVSNEYRTKIREKGFLSMVERATPYPYLSYLRIGSRPAKRTTQSLKVAALRAIPWVLCWTQTRVLFPTWWGIGRVWKSLSQMDQSILIQAFQKEPLFRSYTKALGFTLAKVELSIWRFYLEQGGLSQDEVRSVIQEFTQEYQEAKEFVHAVSGQKHLIWDRLWLEESIYLRSPMIHPLNLLQILAFQNKDRDLIRLTVTGIASGLMTTG